MKKIASNKNYKIIKKIALTQIEYETFKARLLSEPFFETIPAAVLKLVKDVDLANQTIESLKAEIVAIKSRLSSLEPGPDPN